MGRDGKPNNIWFYNVINTMFYSEVIVFNKNENQHELDLEIFIWVGIYMWMKIWGNIASSMGALHRSCIGYPLVIKPSKHRRITNSWGE
jgi:hypothetical protein